MPHVPVAPDSAPPAAAPRSTLRRRWRDFLRNWGLVVAISAAGLSVLAVLGDTVVRHPPGALDDFVRAWTLAHRTPALTAVFEWITRLGAPTPVLALAALVALWLWRAKRRHVAPVVLAGPVTALVVFNVVKRVVQRTRPAGGLLLHQVTFSFPSGHATTAAAVFGTLGWVLAREGKVPWAVAAPLAVACPLLIGMSRVYLDVHWTTDVLAGWCAGAAVAALSAGVYERGRRRRPRPA